MIKIDKAILAEIDAILNIDQLCFDENISNIEVKYYILHSLDFCLTAYYNGFICGFIIGKFSKNKTISHIVKIAVHPNFQNKSIGKMLINNFYDIIKKHNVKKVRLQVHTENIKAVDFYKKLGFNIINLLPNFYGANKNAHNMEKIIVYE